MGIMRSVVVIVAVVGAVDAACSGDMVLAVTVMTGMIGDAEVGLELHCRQ